MTPLEFRQLSHFVAVAEERSFTKAARRVHIVQSGISASISALERDLGVDLFYRTRHTVELTEAGRTLLVEARRVLAALAAASEAVDRSAGNLTGTLRVGVMTLLPADLRFAGPVARMRELHPGVALKISEVPAGHHDLLKDDTLDLTVAPGHGPPGVTSIVLATYPIVFVCKPTHRLADQRAVSIGALRDETFVATPPDWLTSRVVDRAFTDAGLDRHAPIEVAQVPLILDLVMRGIGVALLPALVVPATPELRRIPLETPLPDWDLTASFLGTQPSSAAAREFLRLLISDLRDRGD